jgi:hypothetical protein
MATDKNRYVVESAILGLLLLTGLATLGFQLSKSILNIKLLDRSVEVKGLSEREVQADIAIWPITFNMADNDLGKLYATVQEKNQLVIAFLKEQGFEDKEITISAPSVVDKLAREYGDSNAGNQFRYTANSTITVYSQKVDGVRNAMTHLADLGQQGIAIAGDAYSTQYIYSKLNDIKPAMIEEATKSARASAEKFAKDSDSSLGKIKRASQGQFSIENRDSSTAHIKKVRVVSTVEYYLSD